VKFRELAVAGAYAFTPDVHADDRGTFCSPIQVDAITQALGHPLFPVIQGSVSRSRRGVARGVHYTALPGSMAKFVHCAGGLALDFVIDIRVGSPTFGVSESVVLDPDEITALYLPVGVGHLFIALEDDTVMSYLLSADYEPAKEHALHPLDLELALELPDDVVPQLSERDRLAPTLAQARAAGTLPDYADCITAELALTTARRS